jgi:PAS domain S-box-containing protein
MKGVTTNTNNRVETGILDNALVMILVLGEKGRVISWNHAAETITGYTRDEVVGGNNIWKQLYPDSDYRNSVTRKITEILRTRKYFENLETTIRTRSGESRVILWNTKEIEDEHLTRTITIGLDVTRERESDTFRESIIDNAYVLLAVLDPQGNILVWNKAAETMTGYSREDVIGRRDVWKHLYPDPAYRRGITQRIAVILSADSYFENLETTILTKSGDRRIISWNTRQIGTAGAYHEIAIGRDITAQRMAEAALVGYMSEMAMRIQQPIEIIRDNLKDTAQLIRDGKLELHEIAMLLDAQARNATQVSENVKEFQKAIAGKNKEIPEAYRKFLEG